MTSEAHKCAEKEQQEINEYIKTRTVLRKRLERMRQSDDFDEKSPEYTRTQKAYHVVRSWLFGFMYGVPAFKVRRTLDLGEEKRQ